MFFTSLFREVIVKEFSQEESSNALSIEKVFEKYVRLMDWMVKKAKGELAVQEDPYGCESELEYKYDYLMEYLIDGYGKVISTYVNLNPILEQIAVDELGDSEVIKYGFVNECITVASNLALNRVTRNLLSNEYFDFEFCTTDEQDVLKLFLTPYGFVHRQSLVDAAMKGELELLINRFFENHNIVAMDWYFDYYKTKYVYAKQNGRGHYYYKLREKNLDYVPFGEQNRKGADIALITQGQINLTYDYLDD